MKRQFIVLIIVFVCSYGLCWGQSISQKQVIADAERQTRVMIDEIAKAKAAGARATTGVSPGGEGQELVSPRTLDSNKLKLVSSRDWTSGFFPGELWFLYKFTNSPFWKNEAEKFTAKIEREK